MHEGHVHPCGQWDVSFCIYRSFCLRPVVVGSPSLQPQRPTVTCMNSHRPWGQGQAQGRLAHRGGAGRGVCWGQQVLLTGSGPGLGLV